MFPPEHMQAHGHHCNYVNLPSSPHFISYQMEQVTLSLITYLGIHIFMSYDFWRNLPKQPGSKWDFGTIQMCVVSLTVHMLYPWGKCPEYQLNRGLYGPEICPRIPVEVKNLLTLPET